MSFEEEVEKDGRGVVFRVDVSLDDFASVAYRWTDKAYESDTAPQPQARLAHLGSLSRGLGEDRGLSAARLEMSLVNLDGALDSLVENWLTTLGALAKFYVGLYEVSTEGLGAIGDADLAWKALGTYRLTQNPTRTATTVDLAFEENIVIGRTIGRTPSISDWYTQDVECPFHWLAADDLAAAMDSVQWAQPLPLAFGDESTPLVMVPMSTTTTDGRGAGCDANNSGFTNPADKYMGQTAWVACVTRNNGYLYDDYSELVVTQLDGDGLLALEGKPPSFTVPRAVAGLTGQHSWNLWKVMKSGPVVVDGVNWWVIWLLVDVVGLSVFMQQDRGESAPYFVTPGGEGGVPTWAWDFSDSRYFNAKPYDTGPTFGNNVLWALHAETPEPGIWSFIAEARLRANSTLSHWWQLESRQHAVNILRDLAYYGLVPALDVTLASLAQTQTTGIDSRLEGWLRLVPGTDAQMGGGEATPVGFDEDTFLSDLSLFAASMDLDLFLTWQGDLGVLADAAFEGDASDLLRFDVFDIAGAKDKLPSREERGAYFNRIAYDSVEAWDSQSALGVQYLPSLVGPWDNPEADVPVTTRLLPRTLACKWVPRWYLSHNPWVYRYLDSSMHVQVVFTTGLRGLLLDLGDYFVLDWPRGEGGPPLYSDVVFRVVGLTLDAANCTVQVTGLRYESES